MPDPLIITLEAPSPDRVDKALAALAPEGAGLSRSRLARLIEEGAIRGPDGAALALKSRAIAGTYAITLPAPAPCGTAPEAIPLDIWHEDDALIVVNKPAGMVVHPAPGSPSGTLVNALMAHCGAALAQVGGPGRPGIVHRIDKDTSGLLVVAKTDHAHQHLAAQFARHTVDRRYLALAYGVIDAADPRLRGTPGAVFEAGGVLRITTLLGRHPTDRQRQAVSFQRGRHAVTRARMLESFGMPPALMLAECRLETGRTHQIRVHLAHAGLGLIGDAVYGGARQAPIRALGPEAAAAARGFPRQALHAASLGFTHPDSGEEMRFDAPLPADMAALIDTLRGASRNPTPPARV